MGESEALTLAMFCSQPPIQQPGASRHLGTGSSCLDCCFYRPDCCGSRQPTAGCPVVCHLPPALSHPWHRRCRHHRQCGHVSAAAEHLPCRRPRLFDLWHRFRHLRGQFKSGCRHCWMVHPDHHQHHLDPLFHLGRRERRVWAAEQLRKRPTRWSGRKRGSERWRDPSSERPEYGQWQRLRREPSRHCRRLPAHVRPGTFGSRCDHECVQAQRNGRRRGKHPECTHQSTGCAHCRSWLDCRQVRVRPWKRGGKDW